MLGISNKLFHLMVSNNISQPPNPRCAGTSVITSDRFRTYSGIRIVHETKELRRTIETWEAEHDAPFEEFGKRYLDVLPTETEISDAEFKVFLSSLCLLTRAAPNRILTFI